VTGHFDTGFLCFPRVFEQKLRWFPRFQVATRCFSCNPPGLNYQNESACLKEQKVKGNNILNYTLTVNAKSSGFIRWTTNFVSGCLPSTHLRWLQVVLSKCLHIATNACWLSVTITFPMTWRLRLSPTTTKHWPWVSTLLPGAAKPLGRQTWTDLVQTEG
jgi:hypothetical protein